MQCAFEILSNNIKKGSENIVASLNNSSLQLQRISVENNSFYREELKPIVESVEWEDRGIDECQYWQNALQKAIDVANDKANSSNKRKYSRLILFLD